MLDGVTLDQLRTFVAAVDEGSFSAAARKFRRAQSAVSDMIRSLELQVGVALFDRSGRYPTLTPQGHALIADARAIIAQVDAMKSRAKGMSEGLEPELSVAIDVFFPIDTITQAAKEFHAEFPDIPLRIYMDSLGGAILPVLNKKASIGIVGYLPTTTIQLISEGLCNIDYTYVVAANHPLTSYKTPIPKSVLSEHIQLVLTDRSDLSEKADFGVMSTSTWRLADVFAKRAFLINGIGWGGMPKHTVTEDIDKGKLVEIEIEGMHRELNIPMSAVYRAEGVPGPAGRWLIERLRSS